MRGYDTYKLDYPPEYDRINLCDACQNHEVEFEETQLCGDCYYERNHGAIIEMLDDAIRHLQEHFENGKDTSMKHADALVSFARNQMLEITGESEL